MVSLFYQDLGDDDRVARAAFNLENDHNSLANWEIAEKYRKQRKTYAQGAKIADVQFGDRAYQSMVRHGWLIKHTGGNIDQPKIINDQKSWCVLKDGILSYAESVANNKPASRYITIDQVISVELYDIYTHPDMKVREAMDSCIDRFSKCHRPVITGWSGCRGSSSCYPAPFFFGIILIPASF